MSVGRIVLVAVLLIANAACSTGAPPVKNDREWETPSRGSEDDPEARDRWYWGQRAYPAERIPVEVHRQALREELGRRRAFGAGDVWANLGPAPLLDVTYGFSSAQNASGRALSIAFHPSDPQTLLLGTAQGGIWKSADRGATWRSVGEQSLPTLAINLVRYSPADANVVYAGTGEPNGSTSIHGAGLLRSNDGGETWATLPARGASWNFDFASITGLHFDVQDPGVLYVTTAVNLSPL